MNGTDGALSGEKEVLRSNMGSEMTHSLEYKVEECQSQLYNVKGAEQNENVQPLV